MNKAVRIVLSVFLVAIMGISLFQIVKIWNEGEKSSNLNEKLIEEAVVLNPTEAKPEALPGEETVEGQLPQKTIPIAVDFEILLAENKDIIGWIYCPGTPVNYPIVQSEDNSYYLRRLPDGTTNTAGTLFADYRASSDFSDLNTVVYGHNMRNGSMFATLPKYQEQKFYDENPVWYLLTPDRDYEIELVAGYVTSSDSDIYYIGNDQAERDAQLAEAIENATFISNVEVSDTDKLITLSTCSYEYENARYVLLGVLTEVN